MKEQFWTAYRKQDTQTLILIGSYPSGLNDIRFYENTKPSKAIMTKLNRIDSHNYNTDMDISIEPQEMISYIDFWTHNDILHSRYDQN